MIEKEKKHERENFEFWQWHHRNFYCPNLLIEKPIVAMPLSKETNCGNVIVEIGKKNLWQCYCRKWEEKK